MFRKLTNTEGLKTGSFFLPLRQGRDSPRCCFPALYLFIYLFDIQVCLIYCCSRRHSADFNTVGSCWPQHGPTAGVQGFELAPASPESGHSEDTGMALPHVFRPSFPSAIFPDNHTSSQLLPLLRHDLSDQFGVESGPGQASECLSPLTVAIWTPRPSSKHRYAARPVALGQLHIYTL